MPQKLRHSHIYSLSYAQSYTHSREERRDREEGKFAPTSSWMQFERFQTAKGKRQKTKQKKNRTQKNPHTYKLKNEEIHALPHSLFSSSDWLSASTKPRSFLLPLSNWSFYRAWVFSSTGSPVPSGCPLESLGLVPLRIDSLSETLLSRGKRRKS